MNPASSLRTMRSFVVRLSGLFGRDRRNRELAAEFESHLEMQIEDNLNAGMTPADPSARAIGSAR